MTALTLTDVTLRDGGHLNDFHFSDEQINKIISAVDHCGIDFIEVGYRNGALKDINNIGVAGLCPDEYLIKCKQQMKKSKMAVMAHCDNIKQEDIIALKQCGVSLLRLAVQKGEVELAKPLIQYAKEAGLLTSVNFTHVSQYDYQDIYNAIENIIPFAPSIIYLADSNGSIHPDKVATIYKHCTTHYPTAFGYHAHDNIGLAQTNAIAAMTGGAQYIDASLAGASRGVGNARLELFIAYLHSMNMHQYDLYPLIDASNFVRETLPKCGYVSEEEFLRGTLNLSAKQVNAQKNTKLKGYKT